MDKEACIAYGSYKESVNHDMTMTGNTAAGCVFAGFIAPAEDCDETDPVQFKNNTAHSTYGYGMYMYPNPASTKASQCVSFGYLNTYKTATSMVTMIDTKLLKAHHLTVIDSEKGASLNTGVSDKDEVEIIISDSFFFGETAANDCPSSEEGKCSCSSKYALMTG